MIANFVYLSFFFNFNKKRSLQYKTLANYNKNLSLDEANKKKERKKIKKNKTTLKTTNSLSTSTPSTSVANRTARLKLTTSTKSPSKIENQKSKLTLDNSSLKKIATKTKQDKLNRTLSSEDNNKKDIVSAISSSFLSNTASNSNTLLKGELHNQAKSFTPLHLTTTNGKILAAVLAEHKKIAAVGYQPDFEMIKNAIEAGKTSSKTDLLVNNNNNNSTGTYILTNNNHNNAKLINTITNHSQANQTSKNNSNADDYKRHQIYKRNPYLATNLDASASDKNSKIKSNSFDSNVAKKSDKMPDSMVDLLNRSAKAREPLITKRKTQIKSDSFDSGTSSPTNSNRSIIADLKYTTTKNTNNNKLISSTTTANKGRSDFARTYALSSSKSPIINDRSISSKRKNNLIRSNTLTDLNNLNSIQVSTNNNSTLSSATNNIKETKNSILYRRPRSDYVTSKYSLLKSKSTHSLNKID